MEVIDCKRLVSIGSGTKMQKQYDLEMINES